MKSFIERKSKNKFDKDKNPQEKIFFQKKKNIFIFLTT